MECALHPTLDIAVVKCIGNYTPDVPTQELAWRDDVSLKKGDEVLIAGYPDEFSKKGDINFREAFTLGSVLELDMDTDTNGQWTAKGLVNHGSSGSPAVINQNGKPVVVGMVFGRSDPSEKQPHVYGEKLDIAPLLNALKEQK